MAGIPNCACVTNHSCLQVNVGSLFHAVMYVDTTLNLTRRLNIGKLVIVFVAYF